MSDSEQQKTKSKELIVDSTGSKVSIALLQNGRLVELQEESTESHADSLNDVFLGKVKKLLPALNAAFVDIGQEKEAFIHYLDLGINFYCFDEFVRRANPNSNLKGVYSHIKSEKPLPKEGKITDVLQVGQVVLVQIIKEPISTKGSRLSAEISLAGRNIVLLPFSSKVSISSKIESKEEKKRLQALVENILPKDYGAIIRTAAEGKNAAVLDAELTSLVSKWETSWKKFARSKSVQKLFSDYDKTTAMIRDLLNDSFDAIYVNSEDIYNEVRTYIATIMPEQEKIVKLYTQKTPIFDYYEVTRQIKNSFGKIVPIRQGAYLVIEHTEAMHVIDVNSGTRNKGKEQEQNIYDVNCYAAEEIARQIRLRDMGGIVMVDFIDMHTAENKNGLYKYMKTLMEDDRTKHTVLPLTKFGLMQITRQRVRPATEINTSEICPVCQGTGKVTSSIVIDETIERRLSSYVLDNGIKDFTLKVNPILGAYLQKGVFRNYLSIWRKKYNCRIKLVTTTDFSVLQFEFSSNGQVLQ